MASPRRAGCRAAAVVAAVVAALLAAGCGSDVAGDPPTPAELPQRIVAARAAGDLMVVLGCTPEQWREEIWDAEGTLDRPSAEEAAAVALSDEIWEAGGLPGGAREALHDRTFRLGAGLVLPVLVDGDVRVLLGYDARGPDLWSVGGAAWCTRSP